MHKVEAIFNINEALNHYKWQNLNVEKREQYHAEQ